MFGLVAFVAWFLLLLPLTAHAAPAPPELKSLLGSSPIYIDVYNPGGHIIGRGNYLITHSGPRVTLTGAVNYFNGERDLERVNMAAREDQPLPVVTDFEVSFLSADGAPELIEKADFQTGECSCHWSNDLFSSTYRDRLKIPDDTFAGATAIVPIEHAFSTGAQRLSFHLFDCTPRPGIFKIDAVRQPGETQWLYHPPDTVADIEISADLGWLTLLAKPFIPKVSVWLDPRDGWQYLGTLKDRYYKGPSEVMVRIAAEQYLRESAHGAPLLKSPPARPAN